MDKEYVPLSAPVACGGPVESWLLAVEKGMVDTLAGLLFRCYAEMKKAKREKWIRDWAGMLSLAAGQIAWTAECTKAPHRRGREARHGAWTASLHAVCC